MLRGKAVYPVNRMLGRVAVVLLFFVLVVWFTVCGDILHLKDGTTVSGTVLEMTEATVTIMTTSGSTRVYPMSSVDYIEKTQTTTTAPSTPSQDQSPNISVQQHKPGDYLEDFSEKKSWFSKYWKSGGFVEMSLSDENVLRTLTCPSSEYGRLAIGTIIEIDLSFVAFEEGGAGLCVAAEDGTKHGVDINPDGWYRVWRRRPNFDTETKEYRYRIDTIKRKESREIDKGLGTVNHLSLEVADRMIYVDCNGARLTSLATSMSGDLTIGLTVSTSGRPPTTVKFDNLFVTSKSSPSIGS